MSYIDGFVIPVPKKNMKKYAAISKKAGKIWKDHGALEYKECAGDDLDPKVFPFAKTVRAKAGETIVFSWISYKSRAHRDRVNKAIMKDPRMIAMMKVPMPFDTKRMAYGGFKVFVDL